MEQNNQTHWIPLSDLMTGLMMVFMLISVTFMLRVEQTTTLVIREYEETTNDLARALQKEFKDDLKEWDAEFIGDMTIRFNDSDALFDVGSATVKPKFKEIIDDFFPRYIKVITSDKFKKAIKEIKIEGHTSKKWAGETDSLIAYIKNMRLSQARALSTLEHILSIESIKKNQTWIQRNVTANGFSSSRQIRSEDGATDENGSQRVEFRIITNSEENFERIIKQLEQ